MSKLSVYVDGSYNPKTESWGAGAIILDSNGVKLEEIMLSEKDSFGSRQIAGECYSVLSALEKIYNGYDLSKIDEISIFYDYLGIEMWATSKWKARSDVALIYSAKVKTLMMLLFCDKKASVNFNKVKAHSGHQLNDLADDLAKRACGLE